MKKSHRFWLAVWYGKSPWVYLLLPLAWLFGAISAVRRFFLVVFFQKKLSVPVIVVGNISVGGTGKTPLIIALVKYLQEGGHKPGVISRGYGGKAAEYPYLLDQSSGASDAGDEPVLIYRSANCPVCVAPDRVAAAQKLIAEGCTIILSDDGLQHYRLGRSMEIALVDGQRFLGNRYLLPAGPLREKVSRLKKVSMVVVNNPSSANPALGIHDFFTMHVQPESWRNIKSNALVPLSDIELKTQVHAVAGIGNPERFFKTLDSLNLNYYAHAFDDHHQFTQKDFNCFRHETVVMTEKDAVKCSEFAQPGWYSLVVNAQLNKRFWQVFQQKLETLL